ncbi:hypothetical protein PVAP13_1NG206438 [Panicum virgatum]|jgi:hypothetical protein|uniref:Uncharacterized protein n=1 Tax=Panicum virgatum TaxID=38727 RepID=A0A8T0WL54_PANVG|nr:hypothetical protein PVAP13_1NG206438 [Panicum virgatum]
MSALADSSTTLPAGRLAVISTARRLSSDRFSQHLRPRRRAPAARALLPCTTPASRRLLRAAVSPARRPSRLLPGRRLIRRALLALLPAARRRPGRPALPPPPRARGAASSTGLSVPLHQEAKRETPAALQARDSGLEPEVLNSPFPLLSVWYSIPHFPICYLF